MLKAFSLVEMIITLGILAIVMLISTQTLVTIVRVSSIAKYKTVTRNEIGFALELTDRLLSNSNVTDVYVYDTINARQYDPETDTIVEVDPGTYNLDEIYSIELAPGITGNEIHVRPYGYSIWACIGYFKDVEDLGDDTKGYLVKRTMRSFDDGHKSCFDTSVSTSDPLLVLVSEEVKVNDFKVSYTQSPVSNNIFYIDLEMEPVYWLAGSSSTIGRTVFRQAVITTQGLTWY